jgi:NACalpha-BTF3-like transcription factor
MRETTPDQEDAPDQENMVGKTIADVAASAGASRATARRALSGRPGVSAATSA